MASEENEKVPTKEGKTKSKPSPSEVLKNLLESPNVAESVKKSVKGVDFDREFDLGKVSKSILKSVEPIFKGEIEKVTQTRDAFDQLVNGTEGVDSTNDTSIKFCLDALKAFAFELPDMYELLQLKFKNPLIKCVLCNNVSDALRNEAALICERIMEKTQFIEDEVDINTGEKWLSVYLWLVKRTLRESTTRSEVKRVWSMHKLLTRYIVTDSSPVLDLLKSMVTSPNFLQHKEGRQLIARILSFNKALVVPFHLKIKDELPSIIEKSKAFACSYGEVFNLAWTYALPEVKEVLEEEMFQRWMEIYLKLDRPKGLTQGIMGKTIFRILSHLHNSRRLLQFSSAITRLYQPILWRSLKSHHPLERCNAAELFLDVFPLEKPESNIVENSNLMEKQFKQIMDLLKDESHFTRIVAIRGVIPVFQRRIQCLSNAHCREILSWLANDLANDGSSYLVRVAVWEFFSSLAASDDPPEFLTSLLPQMTNHFHDLSEKVRKAFATMLLHISQNNRLGISVTDVAPRSHIIARLALEGEAVGKILSKLTMKSIYTEGMEILDFVKRLKRLIMQCPKSAENLFRWSENILTVENAHFMILAVLVYLRQFTKDRLLKRPDGSGISTFQLSQVDDDDANSSAKDNQGDNVENERSVANQCQPPNSPSASPILKKRKKNRRSQILPIIDEGEYDVDGPTAEIHAHLIGCVHTLWVVFSKQLESNPTKTTELNQVLNVCLQNYLRCYKGTPAWYASLSLASLVPLAVLSDNSIASSSCLAELRKTELNTPIPNTEALIYSLTAWNRGYEIIELAIDYIDPAFQLFQLNSSVYFSAREGRGRRKVVKFVKDGGREMVGLRLLSLLFRDHHNEVRLLLKFYEQVHELFSYLEGIKVILEARFGQELSVETSTVLTDSFIKECLEIMVDLIPILDRSEPAADSIIPTFSSTKQMSSMIEWATRILLPHVKDLEKLNDLPQNNSEESEEENMEEEEEKSKTKKRNRKRKQNKKSEIRETQEDLCVSCLKIILKEAIFMINIGLTDTDHSVVSANFALALIKTEGKFWFAEDCFELVEALSDHIRVWHPKDEDRFLSIICPSVYSHILLAFTTSTYLTQTMLCRYNCNLGNIKKQLLVFPNVLIAMYGTSNEIFTKVFRSIVESCVAAVQSEAIKTDCIETIKKIEELPLAVTMVTQAIFSHPKLFPLFLNTILKFAQDNNQDGVQVVCSISYLYTLLEDSSKKFDRVEMVYVVQTLHEIVQTLTPSADQSQTSTFNPNSSTLDDSFFLEPLAKLDTKKIGLEVLQKIADSISCQLVRPPSFIPLETSIIKLSE